LDSVSKKRILTLDDIILEEALAAGASLASKNQRSFDQIKEALQASIDAEKKIPQELERLRAIPIETGLDAVIVGYYTDLIQWQV
jgi:ferritin